MTRPAPITKWNAEAVRPTIDPRAYVDETALLIGDVRVASGACVLPRVVLRADEGAPIVIGENTNLQDGVIMHALLNTGVHVGARCSVAHGAIVHGPCELASGCFVGFTTVLLKVKAGPGCFISHRALVQGVELPENTFVPPGAVVTSQEEVARLPKTNDEHKHFAHEVLEVNEGLRQGYLAAG